MQTDPTHPFDMAIRLDRSADAWSGHTHDAYWNMNGPFGGTTAATLLRTALEITDGVMEPVAMTVNFCAPVQKGAVELRCREVRSGKSVRHYAVEMFQGQREVVASASVVTATRRDSWEHQFARIPAAPKASQVERLDTSGHFPWLERFEFRFIEGVPELGRVPRGEPASPRSMLWVRDAPARALDFQSLASLCDVFFIRIFQVRGVLSPAGTVSMTIHFHASSDDLARRGDRPLLGVADAAVFRRNFSDQTAQLWSEDGQLLATSTQVVWFKE